MKQLENLIGKELQLFPSDRLSKHGILIEVSSLGFLFEITKSKSQDYNVGDKVFFSIAKPLTFKTL